MSGLDLGVSVWLLFGRPPPRIFLMLEMSEFGVIRMRGVPVALPTFATVQLRHFFDSGRAIRCLLPIGSGRFMNLVVLYGYQGADFDAEQLASTEQLFDAALVELGVVAWGQSSLIVGDFNVGPTKVPCLAKGFSAGLWVDLEAAWALTRESQPAATCWRTWDSPSNHRRGFMVGCALAAAAVTSCKVEPDGWIAPHFAVRTNFDGGRWACKVTQPVQCTPLWFASWLPAVYKSRVLSQLRCLGFGRCMMKGCS